jgi:DNA-binding MarR family transcriptional regulator
MTPRTPRRPQPTAAPSVREAIQQTKPFSSVSQEGILALFLAADAVRRTFSQLIEEHVGLTLQQYNVLRILRGAGEQGLPTLEIPERMIEQAPGITRLVDRLEQKKWVERERSAEDRRQVICRITKSGLALLERVDQHVAGKDDEALAMLTKSEQRELIELLNRIRAGHRPPATKSTSIASKES